MFFKKILDTYIFFVITLQPYNTKIIYIMKYVKKYIILYSINGNPYMYKYDTYKAFNRMCNQMIKKKNQNTFDYVNPQIIIEWNSLQDLFSGTSYGSITPDGQPVRENTQIMETANKHVKNSKQLTLNV